jgi:hypothetical protein
MRIHHASFWAFVAGAIALGGCVGGSKGLSSEDKERLKPYVLEALPADVPNKIDVNFENKIHLIGFKAEPEPAKPGTDVKITMYWRCDEPLDSGWMLFTHIQDDFNDGPVDNLDWASPIREKKGETQILGPDRWEKGKIYVDEESWKVKDGIKGATFSVYTGIWKGEARLRIVTGPNDGDNRAIAGKVKTGLNPAAEQHTENKEPPVPSLIVNKLAANTKITIDGKADEKEWGGAASTGPFVDVSTGAPNMAFPVNGSVKLLWDDQNVYALYDVKSSEFYTGFTDAASQPKDFTAAKQPKLWTKDTVEMMVDPDGDGDNNDYYELQINPQNKVFKSQFDTLQKPSGGENGPFGHEDWDPKLKSAVVVNKDKDGKTTGYTVEVAIPWAGFTKAQNKPPKPGDVWRMNFYAMKSNGGVSWSPILRKGNFHHAPRFGRVTWSAGGSAPSPSASAVASAAPSAAPSASTAAIAPPSKVLPQVRHVNPNAP